MIFDLIHHVTYLQRGLLTEHEFCFLLALDYYRSEYQRGGLTVVPGKETTQRAGRCILCGKKIAKGAPKFLSRSVGWVHFDGDCTAKIIEREENCIISHSNTVTIISVGPGPGTKADRQLA